MRGRPIALLCTAATLAAAGIGAWLPGTAAADSFTVKTLHFDTVVGPNNDTHCDVIGDLYKPNDATAANPAPAILTTNGFGGSKDDQATLARSYAARGYVVLSYSGLGFGGSGCKIELDDPDWDGKAGSQLISFLGGSKAATDGTRVDYVIHDATAHDGKHYRDDPRVGMIGGSYGGEIQFAVAGVDPRLDAIVPQITWNDLAFSLTPNDTSLANGVTYTTPGVPKSEWPSEFFALGTADGVEQVAQGDPSHLGTCPNFDPQVCPSELTSASVGYPDAPTLALLRHASVSTYMDRIRIPTLLAQGQTDSLFVLQEAAATYQALRARNVPVKMLWRSSGHSGGDLGNSEDDQSDPEAGYESRMDLEWFDWYLRGIGSPPLLDFSYYRDWIPYHGDAAPAVGSAPSYPAADPVKLYLSGSGALVDSAAAVIAGQASFTTLPAGAPASYTETSAVDQSAPLTDTPGTFASYLSPPLTGDLDVVGIPTLNVHLSAPTFAQSQALGPAGMRVLFIKLEDVAPDGSVVLPHRLVAAVRIPDVTQPVNLQLPGIVHRFAKGDRIKLVIAASDAAYKGNQTSGPVTVVADPGSPDLLVIPRSDPGAAAPSQPAGMGGPGAAARAASLPAARACASRRGFAIRLARVRRPDRVVKAIVLVNGRRVRVIRGRRLRAPVNLRGLPRGTFRVTVELRTARGRTLRSARTYHTCVARRARQRR
jgi:ABC-2 type transport system ATP-binding protein